MKGVGVGLIVFGLIAAVALSLLFGLLIAGVGVVLLVAGSGAPPQPRADELKKCPKCAEMVRQEAVICRYCQYQFPERQPGSLEALPMVEASPPERCPHCGSKYFHRVQPEGKPWICDTPSCGKEFVDPTMVRN